MGGKALKKVQTQRLEKMRYENVKNKIANILIPYIKIQFLYEVSDKKDFGDLDILYDISENHIEIVDLIKRLFYPKEIVKNGTVLSFSYLINEENQTYFQIDLIKSNNLKMDLFYFSYGDLGGILGRITKHYGVTFGNTGLWLNLEENLIETYLKKNEKYNKTKVSKSINDKIILTQNPEEISIYLGLDYKKWEKGFSNNQEIYDFVIQTHFFKSKLFEISSLNHEHMRRYNKRPMYREFVDYVLSINSKEETNKIEMNLLTSDGTKLIDYEALIYFNKMNDLEKLIEKNILQTERKEKFNGHMIQSIIKEKFNKNIEDKELGIFIMNFKNHILKKYIYLYDIFENYIDIDTKENIYKDIINFYNLYELKI